MTMLPVSDSTLLQSGCLRHLRTLLTVHGRSNSVARMKSPSPGLCNCNHSVHLWTICLSDLCAYTQRLLSPPLTTNSHRFIQGCACLPLSWIFMGWSLFEHSALVKNSSNVSNYCSALVILSVKLTCAGIWFSLAFLSERKPLLECH